MGGLETPVHLLRKVIFAFCPLLYDILNATLQVVLHRLLKKRKRVLAEWDKYLAPECSKHEDRSFKEMILRRLFKKLDVKITGRICINLEGQKDTKNEHSDLQVWARKLTLVPPRSPTIALGHTYARLPEVWMFTGTKQNRQRISATTDFDFQIIP